MQSEDALRIRGDALGILMNIIYLEGAISSLEKVKAKDKYEEAKKKYDLWIKNYSDKLDRLTQKRTPDNLIELISKLGV